MEPECFLNTNHDEFSSCKLHPAIKKANYALIKTTILLLLILGCFLPEVGCAQTANNYAYGYDGSGNRTARKKVISLKSSNLLADTLSGPSAKSAEKEIFGDSVEKRQITIYPNPTKGIVNVEIALDAGDNARITVFDLRGRMLMDLKGIGRFTDIDLSNRPMGIYLMKISIGNKSTTWKIIKQN